MGNVNKVITTLHKRPFGNFNFKAAKLMRYGSIISYLLNIAATWINITSEKHFRSRKTIQNVTRKTL